MPSYAPPRFVAASANLRNASMKSEGCPSASDHSLKVQVSDMTPSCVPYPGAPMRPPSVKMPHRVLRVPGSEDTHPGNSRTRHDRASQGPAQLTSIFRLAARGSLATEECGRSGVRPAAPTGLRGRIGAAPPISTQGMRRQSTRYLGALDVRAT